MKRWILMSYLLLLPVAASIGQQFSLRQYTVVDGLPQSQVTAMIEDKQGYLWIGTNGGLARFDGREFKIYNTLDGLQSNFVLSLTIDQNQNLWIVHPRGITRFDGLTFKKFYMPGQSATLKRIRRLVELQDSIVIISASGEIGKIQNDSVYYWQRPIASGKKIFSAYRAPSREVYFYLNDSSFLVVKPGGERRKFSHKQQFGKVYNMVNFRRELLIDTDSGFFFLDPAHGDFARRSVPAQNHLIAYDTLNDIYWTRGHGGFFREKRDGARMKVDTVFRDLQVNQLLFDGEGITWFCTAENGLYKYFNHDFERCLSDKLMSVMAIEEGDDGTMWVGSATKGLVAIRKGKVRNYELAHGESAVYSIRRSPSGQIWVASNHGLGLYRERTDDFLWYQRKDGLSSQYIVNIDFDEEGGVWCGTSGSGVNYFDGKTFRSFLPEHGLAGRNANAIRYFKANKSLYVGTEFGLSVIHDNKVGNVTLPELTSTNIMSIHPYNDSLLMLGTAGAGIVVLNPTLETHKFITMHDGLHSNSIYFVQQDSNRDLWIGTERGITRLQFNDNLEIVENLHFGFENGLTGLEANRDAVFLGREKYFGLVDGVYQYDESIRRRGYTYDLHLTDVDILFGEFSSHDYADGSYGFFRIPERLVLPPDRNHITFRFNRVEKLYPTSIKYKYRLENFDKKWSQPTSIGSVTYGNLPPGEYVLQIIATNGLGRWDKLPLRYAFTIEAPFYRTGVFVIIIGILLVGLIMVVLRYNVRRNVSKMLEVEHIRQLEQDSLRKEIARDFHDEMGNQLTRIINYVSLMKLSENGTAKEMYDKVEESAKYLYTGTRDFIWSIDPGNDELSKVFIHIRDFGEKLFEEKCIQFRAFNEVREIVRIPYGFSREVNLIMKEAMTNVFSHSAAKNVSFTMRLKGQLCELSLTDDGRGFDPEKITRNGIKNMLTRAGRMGATLEIYSAHEKGTTVRLEFQKIKSNPKWPMKLKRGS